MILRESPVKKSGNQELFSSIGSWWWSLDDDDPLTDPLLLLVAVAWGDVSLADFWLHAVKLKKKKKRLA